MSRAAAAAIASALLGLHALPAFAQAPQCTLVRMAEWQVRFERDLPVVEGWINGKKVGVLIDTGAYASLVTKAAAEKLDLATRIRAETMIGFGGESQILVARIDELRIGQALRENLRIRVGGERPIRGVDLILGDDFFRSVDLEFDYAKGVVRLFQPRDCKGVSLAYWDRNAPSLPMENDEKVTVAVRVNGRSGYAMIDSGASASVVALSFAAKVGITPQTPGVAPSSCSGGLGGGLVRQWVARFDAVEVGDETIRDARIQIADYMPEMRYLSPEVILGTDFLRSHRVLVSRSQRRVYFSYTGGQVFPALPGLECDDSSRGGGGQETMAELDRAIAANANDAKAFLKRALLRMRAKEWKGALADLDSAIRIEPSNGVALQARMQVRAQMKDYAGALADSDAAIANGMRVAQMHAFRATLWQVQGDPERALKELDEALRLDPRSERALRSRGLLHFHAGRFDRAEKEFSAVHALRPQPFDWIWLYLARARAGNDDRTALETGLWKLDRDEWPAPVMRHLLGRIDAAELMREAVAGEEKERRGRECEASFYAAERLLVEKRRDEATALLGKARDQCPQDFVEHQAALDELDALSRGVR